MKKLKFPPWALFLGIAMSLVSVILIPLVAILQYFGLATWRTWQNPLTIDSPMHETQTLKDAEANGNCYELNGNTMQVGAVVETYL